MLRWQPTDGKFEKHETRLDFQVCNRTCLTFVEMKSRFVSLIACSIAFIASICNGTDYLQTSWEYLENDEYSHKAIATEFEAAVQEGWLDVTHIPCTGPKTSHVKGHKIQSVCQSIDNFTTSTCQFTFNPMGNKTVGQVYHLLAKIPGLHLWDARDKLTKRYDVVLKFKDLEHKFQFAYSGNKMAGQIFIYRFGSKNEAYPTLLEKLQTLTESFIKKQLKLNVVPLELAAYKQFQTRFADYLVNRLFQSKTSDVSENDLTLVPVNSEIWEILMDFADILWMAEAALPSGHKLEQIKVFVKKWRKVLKDANVEDSRQLHNKGKSGVKKVDEFKKELRRLLKTQPSGRVPEIQALINKNIIGWWEDVTKKGKEKASWPLMIEGLAKDKTLPGMLPFFGKFGSRRQQAVWVNGMCGPFIASALELDQFLNKFGKPKIIAPAAGQAQPTKKKTKRDKLRAVVAAQLTLNKKKDPCSTDDDESDDDSYTAQVVTNIIMTRTRANGRTLRNGKALGGSPMKNKKHKNKKHKNN